jgi:hypothetical protein
MQTSFSWSLQSFATNIPRLYRCHIGGKGKGKGEPSMDSGMLSNFPFSKHELHVAVLEQHFWFDAIACKTNSSRSSSGRDRSWCSAISALSGRVYIVEECTNRPSHKPKSNIPGLEKHRVRRSRARI